MLWTQCPTEFPNIKSAHNLNCHVRRDMGKSEKVEGRKSLHTAGGPTGCYVRLHFADYQTSQNRIAWDQNPQQYAVRTSYLTYALFRCLLHLQYNYKPGKESTNLAYEFPEVLNVLLLQFSLLLFVLHRWAVKSLAATNTLPTVLKNSLVAGMRHNYDISSFLMGGAGDPRPMGRDALSSGCVALDAFREPRALISSFKCVLGLLDLDIKVKPTL